MTDEIPKANSEPEQPSEPQPVAHAPEQVMVEEDLILINGDREIPVLAVNGG